MEIKNSHIGRRAKVPHLSYIGDADIGEGTNIGAGTITANFPHQPGVGKRRTTIGRNVRTGIHNRFVAPVEVGDDAWTAPDSAITEDVPPGALAGFPPRQVTKEGYVRESAGRLSVLPGLEAGAGRDAEPLPGHWIERGRSPSG